MPIPIGKHCLWCGRTLDDFEPANQLYCSSAHRTKQRAHRRKIDARRHVTCPTPHRDAFPHRGTAFRAAALRGHYTYLCKCGVYHLTPDPGTRRTRRTVGKRTIGRRADELGTSHPHHGHREPRAQTRCAHAA